MFLLHPLGDWSWRGALEWRMLAVTPVLKNWSPNKRAPWAASRTCAEVRKNFTPKHWQTGRRGCPFSYYTKMYQSSEGHVLYSSYLTVPRPSAVDPTCTLGMLFAQRALFRGVAVRRRLAHGARYFKLQESSFPLLAYATINTSLLKCHATSTL